MTSGCPEAEASILHDHVQLTATEIGAFFEHLMLALCEENAPLVERCWIDFEASVLAHFDAEEKILFPELLAKGNRAVRVFIEEHRHLRAKLAELRHAANLQSLRIHAVRAFVDSLNAHARHEERILNQAGI